MKALDLLKIDRDYCKAINNDKTIIAQYDEAISELEEMQYSNLTEISKQTGLTKEQIRLKAIEMFKGRVDIIYERMEQFKEDLKNGENPFLDIDKILKEKEELQDEN